MSTYLELCQDLRREVGAAGTGPTSVVDQTGEYARLVNYIIHADEYVNNLHQDWDYLWAEKEFPLVSGQDTYSLADLSLTGEVRRWRPDEAVFNPTSDDYVEMTFRSWRQFKGLYRLGAKSSGDPVIWTQRPDKTIEYDTLPDDTTTVRHGYYKVRTLLAADTDVPMMPAQHHRIIVLYAKLLYGEYENAPTVLAGASAEYDRYLVQLRADELPEQEHQSASERSEQIVVRPV